MFNPVKSARVRVPAADASGSLNASATFWPGVGAPLLLIVRGGKAVNGNEGFDDGQLVMKEEARLKTWFWVSGVSNGPDHGVPFRTAEPIHASWRASVVRIDPAAVRTEGSGRN